MTTLSERIFIEAPYVQSVAAFERRLGITAGADHGTCSLALVFPTPEQREIARFVTAKTERIAHPANYTSRYRIAWDAGTATSGIWTPAFEGIVSLAAGETFDETVLTLEGTYLPPGGIAGRAFDELVGRRVAHITLGALLSTIGDELLANRTAAEAAKLTARGIAN